MHQQTVHRRVVLAVLNTLTGYVDWITMNYISDNGGLLLQMLCLMLSDEQLQLYAAECLLLITSRKVRAGGCVHNRGCGVRVE